MTVRQTIFIIIFALLATGTTAQQETPVKSMQEIAYPADTKKIALPDGVEIAYVDRGQGPFTLLFVHGLGTYLKAWQKNLDSLSGQYRCIALDLPGYGKSGKGDYAFGMSFFASHLQAFCEALDLQNVVLVGHSMGGHTLFPYTTLFRSRKSVV